MTMLASWIGIDTHGPTSAYIVSDSRISWGTSVAYDHGKKVFASLKYPEIFGYAGDVLFPSVALGQIIEMIDRDILIEPTMNCAEKNKVVFDKLSYDLSKYPMNYSANVFQIMHITRETNVINGVYPHFHCYFLSYNKDEQKWVRREENMPVKSGVIAVLGSGATEFRDNYTRYQNGPNQDTSRNVFHCFWDTLNSTKDPYCGGVPQIVGIYRKPESTGKYFGSIFDGKCYFAGTEVPKGSNYDTIEWRNENFERCDGRAKSILQGAQQQPNPLR